MKFCQNMIEIWRFYPFYLMWALILGLLCNFQKITFGSLDASRSMVCDNNVDCREVIMGQIRISNNEEIKLEAATNGLLESNYGLFDPVGQGLTLKVEKGPVKAMYLLEYKLDVFEDFREEIFVFDQKTVGNNPMIYCLGNLRDKCEEEGIPPSTPFGDLLDFHYGKCCWCSGAPMNTYKRANFDCNSEDGVFLSISCPRISSQWYSAFEIPTTYRMDSTIKVTMSWWDIPESDVSQSIDEFSVCQGKVLTGEYAANTDCQHVAYKEIGTIEKVYFLNSSSPQIYDEEYGVRVKIITDVNAAGWMMPDISDKVAFIPYELDSNKQKVCSNSGCLMYSLFIPQEDVDFSGNGCDKVGTSLGKWGSLNGGTFCEYPPGTCMGNQLSTYINKIKSSLENEYEPTKIFGVSPTILGSETEEGSVLLSHIELEYKILQTQYTLVDYEIEASALAWMRTTSTGVITNILVPQDGDCSADKLGGCLIKVYIVNTGTEKAQFTVQVPACVYADTYESSNDFQPILPISGTIEAGLDAIFTLIIRVSATSGSSYICQVHLYDTLANLIDKSLASIQTGSIESLFQGAQPLPTSIQVNSEIIDENGQITLSDIFEDLGSTILTRETLCNCGLNIICFITQLIPCLTKAFDMVISIISFFLIIGLIICAWPIIKSLFSIGLALFSKGKRASKKFSKKLDKQKKKLENTRKDKEHSNSATSKLENSEMKKEGV